MYVYGMYVIGSLQHLATSDNVAMATLSSVSWYCNFVGI